MSRLTASIAESAGDPLDEPLTLPPERARQPRPPVPVVAMAVPLVGAVALWLVTGSILSLWLALLGPLIAGATILDGMRASRRDRRRSVVETDAAHARAADAIDARHEKERMRRRARHPDVAGYLLRDDEIWRRMPGRDNALVVGSGDAPSGMQLSGGGADERSIALRRRARVVNDVPVVVPASAGIAVVGPEAIADAVVRGLAVQMCLANPPGQLRLVGPLRDHGRWADRLPHRRAAGGTALAIVGPGDLVPPEADFAIVRALPSSPVRPGCGAVLTVTSPHRARLDLAGEVHPIAVEAISLAQAEHIAAQLAVRSDRLPGADEAGGKPVPLAGLLPDAPTAGLSAVIGLEGDAPFAVDLVADGPHAVVAGITGSGKSELLVTWILALCATRSPREVSLLLADFKGGTAFQELSDLPHVTGLITDLDGAGARRAIESLRAEVRWREAEIARVGARDILDPRVELPRLVVVVDEFAALLGDHPELHAVFTDIAARGRALGLHLVLGTQRASGVVRDALLANCPLRVSLRVADPADSRAVLGTDDAARLPGGDAGRGLALVRRAADVAPRRVRVALSAKGDVSAVAAAAADDHRPRRPWLPDLPLRVELADLTAEAARPGTMLLGLADEPDQQRQVPVALGLDDRGVLVVGAAGAGKSTALRTIAAQAETALIIPADPEGAWDAVAALGEAPPPRGTVVVIDDLDALVSRFPHEYGAELGERLERIAREAGDRGLLVVAAAQRLNGTAGRVADILPRRVLLGAPSRSDYIALGGEPSHYANDQPPGRARIDGRAVQVAIGPARASERSDEGRAWFPTDRLTGFATRRSPAARECLDAWEGGGIRILRVADAAAHVSGSSDGGPPTVVVGDAEEWQRHWQALASVRNEHALVIDTSVAADFRALSADRALPPYCAPGRARAWLCRDALPAQRITLPRAGQHVG